MKNKALIFLFLSQFLISCTSQLPTDPTELVEESNSLYLSKNLPNKSNLIESIDLRVGQTLNLYSLKSDSSDEYSNVAVKWSLSGSMGNLNVQAGGTNSVFSATAVGTGTITIEADTMSKVISIEVKPALDSAPVASNLSFSNFYRGIAETITLSYSDTESDLADTCNLSNLTNLVVVSACSCDSSGVCEVKVKGLSDGSAGFDYWVTSNSLNSNTAEADITVNQIGASTDDEWIKVPQNAGGYGLDSFYVMKYEAKAWNDLDSSGTIGASEVSSTGNSVSTSTHIPVSVPDSQPWRGISPVNSVAECQSLGANYDLISNVEWMALSKNIEVQAANWSSGVVGTGCLNTGNGSNTVCGYNSPTDPDSGSSRDPKAKHVLSNGEEIYDLSGNLVEWVDWDIYTSGFQKTPLNCHVNWTEITSSVCSGFGASNYLPFDTSLDSSNGIGQIVSRQGASNGALARGGSYVNSSSTIGLYSFNNYPNSNYSDADIGFRCVLRP